MVGDAAVVDAWAAAPAGAPSARLAPLLDALAGAPGPRTLAADDALACDLLAGTGGAVLEGTTTCPSCGERVDVTLELPEAAPPPAAVEAGGRTLRLPTAEDVEAAAAAGLARAAGDDPLPAAARALLERLLDDPVARDDPAPQDGPAPLDDEGLAALDAALAAAAPASPPPVALGCPACGHGWAALVDLAAFAWDRVDRRARRLLGEVHRLASAYGWAHEQVLALPATVRRRYLELVS